MTTILILLFLGIISKSTAGGGSLYNAALYKPAYQSSLYVSGFPYLANDGNNTDIFDAGHCQHTLNETWPWWMVDLRGQFDIEKLVLTNRAEFPMRLRNFTIDIFEKDPRQLANFPLVTGQICYSQIPPLTNGTFTWQCPAPIDGRFVRLIMFETDYLHFCELEVYITSTLFRDSSFLIHMNQTMEVDTFMTATVDDVMTCSQQCLSHRENGVRCTAFNWFEETKKCHLLQIDPRIPTSLEFQTGCNVAIEEI